MVNGSAVLQDDNGRFTVTMHLRPRLHDPETIDEEANHPHTRSRRFKAQIENKNYSESALAKRTNHGHRLKLKEGEYAENGVYSKVGAHQQGGIMSITKTRSLQRPWR